MQSPSDMREVRGSARDSIPGARAIAPVAPDEVIDVTVRLRPASATAAARVYDRHTARRRGRLAPITREELARRVVASSSDARAVAAFAHDAGLTVADVDLPRRTIVLRGSAQALQAAFGTPLQRVDTVDGSFRQRTGPILVPAALSAIVTGVFGLDDRPQASPHFRRRIDAAMVSGVAVRGVSYSPPAMAHVYQFPPQTDGTGQCIAIIELGGGYRSADLVKYFDALPVTAPTVIPMGVDCAQNAPWTSRRPAPMRWHVAGRIS
jgi:kumamolisin